MRERRARREETVWKRRGLSVARRWIRRVYRFDGNTFGNWGPAADVFSCVGDDSCSYAYGQRMAAQRERERGKDNDSGRQG
eukprot:scaffold23408_cov31-Tisochrysis_lutea.AAC.1